MKFLIVKTSSLGDIVHCFPVIAYLRKKFPDAQIDWVVETAFADLVEAHPDIHQVYRVDSRKWRRGFFSTDVWQEVRALCRQLRQEVYDVVFDLQGNMKSAGCTFMSRGKAKVGFGFKTVFEWPNILFTNRRYNVPKGKNVREEYLYIVQKYFGDPLHVVDAKVELRISSEAFEQLHSLLAQPSLANREKVMVCPGSNWRNKQVKVEALFDFLKRLHQVRACGFLFIWGNEAEKKLAHKLHDVFPLNSIVVDKLPLPSLQNLMAKVDWIFSMDSLPLHMAATTTTPTFSVFGASSAQKYKPLGDRHRALQGPCPYGLLFERRCPALRRCKTGACIRDLTGQAIFNRFLSEFALIGKIGNF